MMSSLNKCLGFKPHHGQFGLEVADPKTHRKGTEGLPGQASLRKDGNQNMDTMNWLRNLTSQRHLDSLNPSGCFPTKLPNQGKAPWAFGCSLGEVFIFVVFSGPTKAPKKTYPKAKTNLKFQEPRNQWMGQTQLLGWDEMPTETNTQINSPQKPGRHWHWHNSHANFLRKLSYRRLRLLGQGSFGKACGVWWDEDWGTPLKTNMEPKHDVLKGIFQGSSFRFYVSFGGRKVLCILYKSNRRKGVFRYILLGSKYRTSAGVWMSRDWLVSCEETILPSNSKCAFDPLVGVGHLYSVTFERVT